MIIMTLSCMSGGGAGVPVGQVPGGGGRTEAGVLRRGLSAGPGAAAT